MLKRSLRILLVMVTAAVAGCTPLKQTAEPKAQLLVRLLYPSGDTSLEMGRELKSIVEVRDEAGQPVPAAKVKLTIMDPSGQAMGVVPAEFGSGDVYRSQAWTIPHRSKPGGWSLTARATTDTAEGSISVSFPVEESVSEMLLRKYGFWVDEPTLKSIQTTLGKEQGDADNGDIIWGGVLPTQHIFVESWLEVDWRKGDFHISTPEQARAFMLDQVGNFGVYPVRELGPFSQVQFKDWAAWQATARGQLAQHELQWMVLYAPEADKTYAIGTMVALPPQGIDAHAALRDSFEVHPEVKAAGVAPAPLPVLLPEPTLISPTMEDRFMGRTAAITLKWMPLKDLAADEYYQVRVDYNYSETNTAVKYSTRQTELRLPSELYDRPNCGIYNWQVTLMKQTGVDRDGQPVGTPISANSLYWYVQWQHPRGEESTFEPICPNPQV